MSPSFDSFPFSRKLTDRCQIKKKPSIELRIKEAGATNNRIRLAEKTTPIRCNLPFSEWFGTKRTLSVWFQIDQKMVNTIWFRFELIIFRKYISVCKFFLPVRQLIKSPRAEIMFEEWRNCSSPSSKRLASSGRKRIVFQHDAHRKVLLNRTEFGLLVFQRLIYIYIYVRLGRIK